MIPEPMFTCALWPFNSMAVFIFEGKLVIKYSRPVFPLESTLFIFTPFM